MELTLSLTDDNHIDVACDDAPSHTIALADLKLDGKLIFSDPAAFGLALYKALFPDDSPARKALKALSLGDRILLVTTDDVLQVIPYEYLHDGTDSIVKDYLFVRGLPADKRKPVPALDGGLHIVAIPSEPLDKDVQPLNIEGEWRRLEQNVQDLDHAVALERLRPPTVTQLSSTLTGKKNSVIHFMGHGANTIIGSGLVFEDNRGAPKLATARDVINRVHESAFLVTLNACISATPGPTDFDNMAAALIANGVPYALGMRFVVDDTDALTISRTFYDQLARGESVEKALRKTRLDLADNTKNKWAIGVPVLYTSLKEAAPGFTPAQGQPHIIDKQPALDVLAIPRAEGAFQGRVDELKQLGGWLTGDDRPRIVTIQGGGGQGKTALAREAVERFAWDSPGGVYAASLETLPERAAFVSSLALFLALDISKTTDAEAIEKAVVGVLNTRRILLVLDNAETLLEAIRRSDDNARQLANFFRETLNGARVQILITSREHTGWSGERVLELPGLSDDDGAELFRDNAPNRRTAVLMPKARELSQTVGGHPLSLRLLGSAFNAVTQPIDTFIADYETRLREAQDQYTIESHRHHSLYAAIETSVRHLDDDLRDLLSGLWVFHAPFQADTAVDIFDPDGEYEEGQQSPIYDRLSTLQRRGLLARETHTMSEGTFLFYRLLPGVRLYAKEMPQAAEKDTLLARFGTACYRLIRLLGDERGKGTLTARWLPLLAPDLERGLNHVEDKSKAHYLNELALVYSALGDKERALDFFQQALARQQQVGDIARQATILNNIGQVHDSLGDKGRALDFFQQALSLIRQVGDKRLEAITLNNIGHVNSTLGDKGRALNCFQQALPIFQQVGDIAGQATTLNNIGLLYSALGDKPRALAFFQQALPLSEHIGDIARQATILNNIGAEYSDLGDMQRALDFYNQALARQQQVGDIAGQANTLNNIGKAYVDLGDKQLALTFFRQALPLRQQVGDIAGQATTLNNIGSVYFDLGDKGQALNFFNQSLILRQQVGDPAAQATILTNMAVLYAQMGKSIEAIEHVRQSIAILQRYGLPQDSSGTTLAMHILLLAQLQSGGHRN